MYNTGNDPSARTAMVPLAELGRILGIWSREHLTRNIRPKKKPKLVTWLVVEQEVQCGAFTGNLHSHGYPSWRRTLCRATNVNKLLLSSQPVPPVTVIMTAVTACWLPNQLGTALSRMERVVYSTASYSHDNRLYSNIQNMLV